LGRRRSHERFEHRREILRPIWSNANPDPDFNCSRNSYAERLAETFTDAEAGASA